MKLQEILNQITTLGAQIRAANSQLAADAMDSSVTMDSIQQQQDNIAAMQKRMAALQQAYDFESATQAQNLSPVAPAAPTAPKSKKDLRASNEYVHAFCNAVRNSVTRKGAMSDKDMRILYDALTETGGDPAGSDGGFLVPVDIDNSVREQVRELNPLAPLFNEEPVTALTGWRVMDTAPSAPMPKIDEMGTVSAEADQPSFAKVTYTLEKYGLRIPISNELLADEDAALMAYLSRWFAKKEVVTENYLLLAALKTLTASAMVTGSETPDSAIKKILNKVLDPALSAGAVIITNQNGFDALDQLTDENGRGLLQPDPTNATMYKVYGRRVVPMSNTALPDTSSKPEFFIGNMKEFATLFRRDGLEIASTNIGGNAWATDSTEVRGITRLCVSKFDTAAAVRRQLTLA